MTRRYFFFTGATDHHEQPRRGPTTASCQANACGGSVHPRRPTVDSQLPIKLAEQQVWRDFFPVPLEFLSSSMLTPPSRCTTTVAAPFLTGGTPPPPYRPAPSRHHHATTLPIIPAALRCRTIRVAPPGMCGGVSVAKAWGGGVGGIVAGHGFRGSGRGGYVGRSPRPLPLPRAHMRSRHAVARLLSRRVQF